MKSAILLVLLLVACGGKIASSDDGTLGAGVNAGPADQDQVASSGPGDRGRGGSSKKPDDRCSIGVNCQVFEPGGPSRWGCHTINTEPELACEHAAGASIARCNCEGRFGESPFPTDVVWFDIPATSAMPSNEEVMKLWRDRCDGRCVERPVPSPISRDGG